MVSLMNRLRQKMAWGAALLWCGAALAQTQPLPPSQASIQEPNTAAAATALRRWHVLYDVAADGRTTVTRELQQTVLQPQALADVASYDISYLTGLQQGSMLQAYTLKSDGRRIDVPSDALKTDTEAGPPERTRITVRFADLAVGDTVAVEYRIADQAAVLPGAFSLAHGFSPYVVQEDSRISVRAPKAMALRFQAHGLQELPSVEEGDTVERRWEYRNPQARNWSTADDGLWRLEETPVLWVSSFASPDALAKAYGERVLPQAEPTERVRAWAQSVAGGSTDARERARLLYEWVSTQVALRGTCLGLGGMQPQPLDTTLEQRSGNCQDQALLLHALLASVGIRSELVLLNTGDVYELADPPVWGQLNHVINYLPDWQWYLDASSPLIPLGYLPAHAYGKSVLHVGAEPALRRIPQGPADANGQSVHTTMQLAADGSARGRLKVEFVGVQAARMHSYLQKLDAPGQRKLVQEWLARAGYKGRGELELGAVEATPRLPDRYTLGLSFEIDNYLQAGTQGAFVLAPVVDLPLSVVSLAVAKPVVAQRRVRCYGYHSEEVYDITLAPGVALTRWPQDFQVRGQPLRYSGRYERTPQGLHVERSLRDETPQGLCEPAFMQTWADQVQPIAQSLQGLVYYRLPAAWGQAAHRAKPVSAAPTAHKNNKAGKVGKADKKHKTGGSPPGKAKPKR